MRAALITFTSDYPPADEFVGVCHSVIARIAPRVRVVDLAHGLRGIRAGAAALAKSVAFAPARAVHLAIVDPGVGTDRLPIVVTTASGAVLVGPDNGLLLDASDELGGATAAFELASERYRLQPVSSTFHGRDVFAPAAAFIASGVAPSELGPAVALPELIRLPEPQIEWEPGCITSEVLRADGYGNIQLAARSEHLSQAALDGPIILRTAEGEWPAIIGRTFADAPDGGLVLLPDSVGHLAIAVNGGSAWSLLGRPGLVTVQRTASAKS